MSAAIEIDFGNVESWSGKDKGDENFPVGSWLIHKSLRWHIHAFYQFARIADDIADHASMPGPEKLRRLEVMRAVLCGEQTQGSPSASGLRASLAENGVNPAHALELLHAFRQDAVKNRYASWDELLDYCRYSAMPVGRFVLDLHGESTASVYPPSDALCAVLQILNHLQDGAKDLAAMDRCYLPADLLMAYGGKIEDLRGTAETAGLRSVKLALLVKCDELMKQARQLPHTVKDRSLRLETAIIISLAEKLLARLRNGDPVAARVKLKSADAVFAALGSMRFLP